MTDIHELQKELFELKQQIAALRNEFQAEVTNTTFCFQKINGGLVDIFDRLGDLTELVWPLVHKIFPGTAGSLRQVAAILGRAEQTKTDRK